MQHEERRSIDSCGTDAGALRDGSVTGGDGGERSHRNGGAAVRTTSEGKVYGDLLILNGGTYGAYFTYDAQNDQVALISNRNTVTIKNADPNKQSSTGIKIDCDGDITICLAGVDIKTMGKPAIEIRENTTYDVTIEVVEGTVNELRTDGGAIIAKNCNNEDAGWLYSPAAAS